MASGTLPIPKPGERYYDAVRGKWRYRPKGGGKVVDLHSPEGEKAYHGDRAGGSFDPARALSRAGAVTDRAVGRAASSVEKTARNAGTGVVDLGSAGGFLVTAFATLMGLIVLDLILANAKVSTGALGYLSKGISRLVNPADTLFGPPAPVASTAAAQAAVARENNPTLGNVYIPPKPAGFIVPVPGSGHGIDSAFLPIVQAIEKTFHVTVSSGYRTPAQNAAANGAPASDHLDGAAADFVPASTDPNPGATINALQTWAEQSGLFPYVEPAAQARDHVHISFYRP